MEINKPVATVITIMIALIVLVLFVLPQYQDASLAQAMVNEKAAEYRGKSAYYATVAQLLEKIEVRREVLGKINSALPADFSVAPIVYFLDQKAVENGSTIKSVVFLQVPAVSSDQPMPLAPSKEVKNVVFTVDLTGSYDGLKNFLNALEKSARLFEVETISFTTVKPLQVPGGATSYDFKLQLKTNSY